MKWPRIKGKRSKQGKSRYGLTGGSYLNDGRPTDPAGAFLYKCHKCGKELYGIRMGTFVCIGCPQGTKPAYGLPTTRMKRVK